MSVFSPSFVRLARAKFFFSSVLIVILSGCSSLPGQGPMTDEIQYVAGSDARGTHDYAVIDLNANTVASFGSPLKEFFSEKFSIHQWGNAWHTLGAGDRLRIDIWEASSDGLFSTFDNKRAVIDAVVNENGTIFVPYVGRLQADGMSVEQVRLAIGDGLKGKAVEPQVQVVVSANESNNVVVVGEISAPGQYPVKLGGLKLLDVIAEAGGSKFPVYETAATISRNSIRETVRLNEVLGKKENNVWLLPKDTVEILHKPRTFTAFGAVKNNKHIAFDSDSMSLAEAIASVGGLNDQLADAGGVFLFRFEDSNLLSKAIDQLPKKRADGFVPTIYRLDFNQPQSFFFSQSFMMKDKDIIYVATAPAAEFRKFIQNIVTPILVPVATYNLLTD